MTMVQARPTLLSLPPAGLGPGLFRSWTRSAPATMKVHPVSLPGREARFNDPAPSSVDELADRLARELETYISGRYAIFGYSMGALLGYEIGRRWVDWGLRAPDMFFALGCNAPDRMVLDREPFHTMGAQDFRHALIALGGIDMEILDNPEAMDLFEPILRNDFRICETYQHSRHRGRLDCSAHIFLADSDEFVRWDAASAWSEFVTGRTTMHRLKGRHMIDRDVFDAIPATLEALWLRTGSAVRA